MAERCAMIPLPTKGMLERALGYELSDRKVARFQDAIEKEIARQFDWEPILQGAMEEVNRENSASPGLSAEVPR